MQLDLRLPADQRCGVAGAALATRISSDVHKSRHPQEKQAEGEAGSMPHESSR